MAATLTSQLEQVKQGFSAAPEAITKPIYAAMAEHIQTFDPKSIIQVGDKLPEFKLPSANGALVSSSELLAKGPLLITFYRGQWCPFCNLALKALQDRLDDIKARGATLVAITPELPDNALSTVEKNELKFPVLSDVGLKLAGQLGIVWKQPDTLRPVLASLGHDLKAQNGDDSFAIPVPVTLLVDATGVVRNVYAEADYSQRVEPQQVLDWLDKL